MAATCLSTGQLVLVILPLVIIQLSLAVFCLVDISGRQNVRMNNKVVWVLIILFFNIFGPIIYLAWGRYPEDTEEDYIE